MKWVGSEEGACVRSGFWGVVASVAALPPIEQGFQFGQIPPEGSRRQWWLLLQLHLLQPLKVLPLFAELPHSKTLLRAEGLEHGPRVQRAGPGPGGLLFVCQHPHHGLAQHAQTDFGHGAFEAVLGGQAVVKALVRLLEGADEEAVLGGKDTITQLRLHKIKTSQLNGAHVFRRLTKLKKS